MLGTSEHMLWIQSMPRVPYAYLQMPIGWLCLLVCMCTYTWGLAILRSGVLRRTLSPVWGYSLWWEEYKGETSRTLKERYQEHLKQPSPIYAHIQQTGHNSTPDNFSILGREDQGLTRTIKVVIYIRVNNPTLNRNIGKFNHIWDRTVMLGCSQTLWSSQQWMKACL